ncbi:MAG TPA: peptidyl-tRNA hydrolase, partial [Mycobacteriales bacterium]|nr:peptidyl-tRNA hydrolase [Mycobacteriales bacterium]
VSGPPSSPGSGDAVSGPPSSPGPGGAVSGGDAADPRDRAPQRVLPLVVRVERVDPPARTDALEAAAVAVLTLLADPRSAPASDHAGEGEPAGEWAGAVREWTDARIRKVVRRARGAEWRRAAALPGITVTHRTAEVRVFPPVPLDGWPRDLARLQVSGTDLADPALPPPPVPGGPVLWLNPHLELTAGKAMAQVGHAAQLGWNALGPADRDRWRAAGFALAVRTAPPAGWDRLVAAGLPLVRDAGFTEIAPGTCTAVADHPALRRA